MERKKSDTRAVPRAGGKRGEMPLSEWHNPFAGQAKRGSQQPRHRNPLRSSPGLATEPTARHPAVAAHDFEASLDHIEIHIHAKMLPAGH